MTKPAKPPRELPRGYRVRMMTDGRAMPALLMVHGVVKESFTTEAAARSAGFELADREREFGREVRAFDVREWRRYLTAKRDYFGGNEPDWPALAKRAVIAATVLTVSEAVEKYRQQRGSEGLSPDTLSQIKKKLARFVDSFGPRKLHEVTADGLREWLFTLADGHKFAPWTVKDHLKVVSAFWSYCVLEKWCLENPCAAVVPPKIKAEEINILTVAETAQLFSKSREAACVGRLALEAFGGLRFSSAARLILPDLKFTDKGIELPGAKHKSGRRHYIDGLPANLWAWLAIAPAACWTLTERQYLDEKGKAFIRAGVTSTPNCLRHSFATYHVAANKDASATAVLMQHTSPATLYKHYKGVGTHADGKAYFEIMPAKPGTQ